jgi:DNA-binding transcriptional MerR regulator/methylmalonyl-CoA mutase cobalamin-binding subunit
MNGFQHFFDTLTPEKNMENFFKVPLVSIQQVERETGVSKETLRKWESRYGFPKPQLQEHGTRKYTLDDIGQLQIITRLMKAGHRPGKVVPLPLNRLKELLCSRPQKAIPESVRELLKRVMESLQVGDVTGLGNDLEAALLTQGLNVFVENTLPVLIEQISEQWNSGHIAIFQEHLFSEVLRSILQQSSLRLHNPLGGVRVLMGTAPDELHGMGLTMLQAVLTVTGAMCINLGTQVPLEELIIGAKCYRAQIVAISFSLAYPSRQIAPFIIDLRRKLPSDIALWVGGAGIDRLHSNWPGVDRFKNFGQAVDKIQQWNK